jgi:sigma-B regulation protein RsbU (phosphoserine phosphatase)
MFGFERMTESLNKYKTNTAQEILDGIRKDVSKFVGKADQFDDLTMLCLRYNGPVRK